MVLSALTPGMAVVFALIGLALVLFATEVYPVDVTAIAILVALLLVEPVTTMAADAGLLGAPVYVLRAPGEEVSPVARGLSGFANAATITVLAMFILSEGVRRTGLVQILGAKVGALTGGDDTRQLGATIGIVGPISGFINNTAAVAILLPMVIDLAHDARTSPSKLLLPLSYASMFGGMLTLIGTSTNILASQIAGQLALENPVRYGALHEFGMFEFTALGVVVLIVGSMYLMTVGRWLTPARIQPQDDLTEEFQMADYLTEVTVRQDSPIVGMTVRDALVETDFDVDLVQLIRDGEVFLEPLGPKQIRAGDVFAVRTDRDTLVELLDAEGLDLVPDVTVDEAELEAASPGQNLIEVVIAPGSELVGETLDSSNFRQRYETSVLAVRRGREIFHERMDDLPLRVGDTLLVQGPADAVGRISRNRNFIVAQEVERPDFRQSKIPLAVAIVAGVVGVAAVTPISIVVTALAGVLAMALTGVLRAHELYDAVQWDVIFLLAGVIPLGVALQQTGGAALIADGIVAAAPTLSALGGPIAVLGLVYVVTALLTNVISNNASVVLMVPVAAEVAAQLGANAFAFVLAVTFAASTAFMTPVGYQTNLFVYGPGGYRFSDYLRVGGPLQALIAVVTTLGIAFFWGLTPA